MRRIRSNLSLEDLRAEVLDPCRYIVTGECWEWSGAHDGRGYGCVRNCGRNRVVTRVVLGLDIGNPLYACHHCDNPKCIRPEHLFAGTQTDNMRDAKAKGRTVAGPGVPMKDTCKRGHKKSVSASGRSRYCRECSVMFKAIYRAARKHSDCVSC